MPPDYVLSIAIVTSPYYRPPKLLTPPDIANGLAITIAPDGPNDDDWGMLSLRPEWRKDIMIGWIERHDETGDWLELYTKRQQ